MQREPAEIEREIELTRTYLADTVDAIAHKVSPKEVAGRTVTKLKAKLDSITSGSVETFNPRTDDGTTYQVTRKLRVDRVGMAAGGVAGVVGLVVALRKFRRR